MASGLIGMRMVRKIREGNYKDDKLDGKWTEWDENGQIDLERNYKDGELVSETKYSYYENGQKKWEENYKDGKLDGKCTAWDENGQKESEENYKDGKQDGKWTRWYENGQKKKREISKTVSRWQVDFWS